LQRIYSSCIQGLLCGCENVSALPVNGNCSVTPVDGRPAVCVLCRRPIFIQSSVAY